MNFITFDEFKDSDDYGDFIKDNPSLGNFKVQVSMGSGGIPVDGVEVLVTKDINGKKVLFFKGETDDSGMIDNIKVPAPKSMTDFSFKEFPGHTDYDLSIICKKHNVIKEFVLQAYGDVKAIQNVNIVPSGGVDG